MAELLKIFAPRENVNDERIIVDNLYFKSGDKVKAHDILLDLETSKVVLSIEAGSDGFVEYRCKKGEELPTGTLLATIYDAPVSPIEHKTLEDFSTAAPKLGFKPIFSNAATSLIKQRGLSFSDFDGCDFVKASDVSNRIDKKEINASRDLSEVTDSKKTVKTIPQENCEQVALSANKRREIEYLSQVASAGLVSSVGIYLNTGRDLNASTENLPNSMNPLLSIIVYELARLLREFREFNAYYDNNNTVFYHAVNIGVAIDIDDGLKVAGIHNTDELTLDEIDEKLFGLIDKYLERKLDLQDVSNITFTVTDLSSEGVHFFQPLINSRQAAILAVSAVDEELGRVALTLAFDHRVTSGLFAARLLRQLKLKTEGYFSNNLTSKEKRSTILANTDDEIVCQICLKGLDEDKEVGGRGFLRIIGVDGKERAICLPCWEGW
jgi:pyruvate/2-oxoglutarate dehydrogenase complex dihydrolipoamide acyltransferase (E2) component